MTNGILSQPQPQAPKEVWGIFAGAIDQQIVQRMAGAVAVASNNSVERVHLVVQSSGGLIGDGVCLYNLFRALPFELVTYNIGSIQSVGVMAFLGAKQRKASPRATFMIHRSYASPLAATSDRLQALAQGLILDDERCEGILRDHVKLNEDQWAVHKVADLWLSAEEAKKAGLVTEIGDFAPPKGTQLFYVGPN
jgi:ATP-dependent Clp protease protease subunit